MTSTEHLIRRKSWLRRASIDLWLKAERQAATDIEGAALSFLRSQRVEVVRELRRLADEKPTLVDAEHGPERVVEEAFKSADWDGELREAMGIALARTIVRGYLAAKAVQAGRRRRFPPVWRKDVKQGWADVPLTPEEEAEILKFELPPSVTRSVFAHTKSIMDKPYWTDMNRVSRDRMQWSIQEGVEEGKTLRQIAGEIEKDTGADETRAARIARTEITGTLNSGHVILGEEAEEAGVTVTKTWVSVGDEKVRPDHEEADGQVVEGANALFDVGGFQTPYPGHADLPPESRINCRCLAQVDALMSGETAAQHVEAYKAAVKGGAGSGNFGHAGRPGEVGGSVSSGGETLDSASRDKDGKWRMSDGTGAPEHIQKLGIPPAWTNVYINRDPKGDMLVRGNDSKGRLQVRYSDNHNMRAAADKFGRVSELRAKREEIRKEILRDAKDEAKQEEAECLLLVMATGIRPGSDQDTKAEKKAYGATTLEGRHVVASGSEVRLRFTGKKGVDLDLPVVDKRVAAMLVKRAGSLRKDERLFSTDANRLRNYSKSKDGGGFKTKDHRTAIGTETAITSIKSTKTPATMKEYKRAVKEVATKVSKVLGNTPTIALKAYIDPNVFSAWRSKARAG